ncbi:MAG: hypothetical protein AAGJ46_10535 [Planctomycetota bacterium]
MGTLRQQVEQLGEAYRADRYAGDLSEVLTTAPPDRRVPTRVWLGAAAAVAACLVAMVLLRTSSQPGQQADATAIEVGPEASTKVAAKKAVKTKSPSRITLASSKASRLAIEKRLLAWPRPAAGRTKASLVGVTNWNPPLIAPSRPKPVWKKPSTAPSTAVASAPPARQRRRQRTPAEFSPRLDRYSASLSSATSLSYSFRRNPHGA